jgi:glycerol-3-phosphate cytidylyltransferase-like family protein
MNANELAGILESDSKHTSGRFTYSSRYIADIATMLRQQQAEIEALKAFVKPIVAHGDDCVGNWDGGELQDLAVKAGLLIEVEKTEPCNLGKEEFVGCPCREYNYGEESWTCYQTAKFLLED